ncbi:hypothetical protein HK096_008134, partial [Nowakowskiella sp. JEL0078]
MIEIYCDDDLQDLFNLSNGECCIYIEPTTKVTSTKSSEQNNTLTDTEDNSSIGEYDHHWVCRCGKSEHHIFISYRVRSDKIIAKNLAVEIMLANPNVHVYLDSRCLVTGHEWEQGFLNGLQRSKVIILLCSEASLEPARHANKTPDNMLLEWQIALLRRQSGESYVFPIMVGSKIGDSYQWFKFPDPNSFPLEVNAHIKAPKSLTIRETVSAILEIQAASIFPEYEADERRVVPEVLNALKLFDEDHEKPIALMSSSYPILTEVYDFLNISDNIRCTQKEFDALREWLDPIDSEIGSIHDALRSAYHPGTREWMFDIIMDWVSNDTQHNVFWMHGGPGVGKSVISAILADKFRATSSLGGVFFCRSDDAKRRDPRMLLRTLAFSLSQWRPEFGRFLLNQKEELAKIELPKTPIPVLYQKLISEPLAKITSGKSKLRVVLIIDGLDECGVINQRAEFLSLIHTVCEETCAGLKLIVSGLDDADIRKAFTALEARAVTVSLHDYMDEYKNDAKNYLWSRLGEVERQRYGNDLLQNSEGLLLWLKFACENLPTSAQISNGIFDLYRGFFIKLQRSLPPSRWSNMLRLLEAILILREPLSIVSLSSILNLPPGIVENLAKDLKDMIHFTVGNSPTSGSSIRLLHRSIMDYLLKPDDTIGFQINEKQAHLMFAVSCLEDLNNLKVNPCSFVPEKLHTEIENFKEIVDKTLNERICYSCRFWSFHVTLAEPNEELFRLINKFYEYQALAWLEAMSLIGDLSGAISSLDRMNQFLLVSETLSASRKRTFQLNTDLIRLLQKFYTPISQCALQIYRTAIGFCPHQTELYRMYFPAISNSNLAPSVQPLTGIGSNWDSCRTTLDMDEKSVNSIEWSPNGNEIAVGSNNGIVQFWNGFTGSLNSMKNYVGSSNCSNAISSIKYSDNGSRVYYSVDSVIQELDTDTGYLRTIVDAEELIRNLVIHPQSQDFMICFTSHKIQFWNLQSGLRMCTLGSEIANELQKKWALSENCTTASSLSSKGTIRIWNLLTANPFWRSHVIVMLLRWLPREVINEILAFMKPNSFIFPTKNPVNLMDLSPEGSILAIASEKVVELHDVGSGKCIKQLKQDRSLLELKFDSTGQFIAMSFIGEPFQICVLNLITEQKLWHEGHNGNIFHLLFSPNSRMLASSSNDNSVRLWDLDHSTNSVKHHHAKRVTVINFSEDGTKLITGSHDNTAKVWLGANGELLSTLKGHESWVISAALSDSGLRAATGSTDGSVRVWETFSGNQLFQFPCDDWSGVLTFSPNNTVLASASLLSEVEFWDLATGEHVVLEGGEVVHGNQPMSLKFSRDNTQLSYSKGNSSAKWEILTGQLIHEFPDYSELTKLKISLEWVYMSDHRLFWLSPELRNIGALNGDGMNQQFAAFKDSLCAISTANGI